LCDARQQVHQSWLACGGPLVVDPGAELERKVDELISQGGSDRRPPPRSSRPSPSWPWRYSRQSEGQLCQQRPPDLTASGRIRVIEFSDVQLTEQMVTDYADTLAYLGAAIRLYRDTFRRLGLLGGRGQGEGQGGQDGDGQQLCRLLLRCRRRSPPGGGAWRPDPAG
jgi:hypothetical protein